MIKIGINYFKEDYLSKAMLCELSNADLAMVIIAREPNHIEKMKLQTKCSKDITKWAPKQCLAENLTKKKLKSLC